ncbi:MAG: flagellar biosynthesis anti-sigma factor FlgM [Polyangiaceae bacterium]
MRVGDRNLHEIDNRAVQERYRAAAKPKSDAIANAPRSGMDRARISEDAAVAAAPRSFDSAKVDRLREALDSGQLQPDSKRIAARMLEETPTPAP